MFSTVYTKKTLLGYFGSSIIVTNINGQPNFVTFKQNASEILHTFYERPKIEDPDAQKKFIIHTEAKLTKVDIKSISSTFKLEYPPQDLISSLQQNIDFVQEALHIFLTEFFGQADSSLKVVSIGQAITQACRPITLISLLQTDLGVQLHHQFLSNVVSKFLVDTLNSGIFIFIQRAIVTFDLPKMTFPPFPAFSNLYVCLTTPHRL